MDAAKGIADTQKNGKKMWNKAAIILHMCDKIQSVCKKQMQRRDLLRKVHEIEKKMWN